MATRSGAQVLIDQLRIHGADTIFGVPGESYLAALDALYAQRNSIRYVICRQEGGAANMAEAYGKLTGKPGIAFVTRGPGATNAITGLADALLVPHRAYLTEVRAVWKAGITIKGLAHITGGGMIENPPRILPKGTAYLTDVGMTGPHDSIIGVEIEPALNRFLTGLPSRFETASLNPRLNAVVVEADEEAHHAFLVRTWRMEDRAVPGDTDRAIRALGIRIIDIVAIGRARGGPDRRGPGCAPRRGERIDAAFDRGEIGRAVRARDSRVGDLPVEDDQDAGEHETAADQGLHRNHGNLAQPAADPGAARPGTHRVDAGKFRPVADGSSAHGGRAGREGVRHRRRGIGGWEEERDEDQDREVAHAGTDQRAAAIWKMTWKKEM